MIYITGDCHSNFERFNTRNFPEQKEMTKDEFERRVAKLETIMSLIGYPGRGKRKSRLYSNHGKIRITVKWFTL